MRVQVQRHTNCAYPSGVLLRGLREPVATPTCRRSACWLGRAQLRPQPAHVYVNRGELPPTSPCPHSSAAFRVRKRAWVRDEKEKGCRTLRLVHLRAFFVTERCAKVSASPGERVALHPAFLLFVSLARSSRYALTGEHRAHTCSSSRRPKAWSIVVRAQFQAEHLSSSSRG